MMGEQGPGDHGKEAAKQKSPRAHTTNGTRARGRQEPGQKPRSHNMYETGMHIEWSDCS
mgnify:CR=1 FL=1|jgi:hypothetical protein